MKDFSIYKIADDWYRFSGGNGERFFRTEWIAYELLYSHVRSEKDRLQEVLINLIDARSFGRTGIDAQILKAQIEYNVFCAYHDFEVMVK